MFTRSTWFKSKVILLIVYGCFLITLSIFKTTEIMLPAIFRMEFFLGGDKLTHLILSSILSFLALWALAYKSSKGLMYRCFIICLLLIIGLLADELHQALVGSRRFEWLDFACGVGGIGLGFMSFLAIHFCHMKHKLTHKY
jgi:hypothetical protein